MPVINEVIRGALKLTQLPDRVCFTSWRDFVQALPDLLSVEVPESVSGVVVSADQPGDDDKEKLWFRRDFSGNFLGLYAFQNGNWHPFYNLAPNEVVWVFGDSGDPPDGFVVILPDDPVVPSAVVTHLINLYLPNESGSFAYFAVRFNGYGSA
jgi:hypothetical protein